MAVPTSPMQPIYHSPILDRNHQRRGSIRKSFTSLSIPSVPQVESPRTLCPRDGDAFSYKPSHLPAWFVPEDLWAQLSPTLQSTLTAMQHSGAAVLTGFERLDKHSKELDGGRPTHKLEEDEFLVQLDALPPPKVRTMRTISNASSAILSDVASPVFTDTDSAFGSPSLSASQSTSPISPISLTPSDSQLLDKSERTRERSFSTPLEPHDAHYAAELSHLRTEALPRLRHSARKVDTEWLEVKRTDVLSIGDINDFENWWAEQKCTILNLNEKGKRLSLAIGLSPTGLGWTAP